METQEASVFKKMEEQTQRPQIMQRDANFQHDADLTRLNVLEDSQRGIGVNGGAAAFLELCTHYKDFVFTKFCIQKFLKQHRHRFKNLGLQIVLAIC